MAIRSNDESTVMGWPDPVRKAVAGGAAIGYGLALTGFVMRMVGDELSFGSSSRGALTLAVVMAFSPTLALLSHPDRPLLLIAAGVTAITGIYGLSIFGYGFVVLGVIWLWAYLQLAPPGRWVRKLAMVVVPVLWLAAFATLWVHLDPACEQRLRDGTVIQIDPASRGLQAGWVWEIPSSFSSSSGLISGDVVFETCTSNTEVWWETVTAILVAVSSVAVGLLLARPTADGSGAAATGAVDDPASLGQGTG
jgi:hypothetical protein